MNVTMAHSKVENRRKSRHNTVNNKCRCGEEAMLFDRQRIDAENRHREGTYGIGT
jgi:hypothetical protein